MRDPDSFDAFYAGSVRRVTSQLYALIGDRAEAEDAVQEAFARAWQRWGKISGYADPEGWVRTVSYRISVSSWRKRALMASACAWAAARDAIAKKITRKIRENRHIAE